MLARQILTLVRHIAGVVGQGQDLASLGIEHHHTARAGFVKLHGIAQFLVSKKLYLAVDAELQVTPIHRRDLFTHVFHHLAQTVFDDPTRTRFAAQLFVEGQLHALLALILHIGEAHHVRCGFALRVLTAVFFALVNALDAQVRHLFGDLHIHLAFEPNKGLVFVFELLRQLGQGDFEQTCQFFELGGVPIHIFRNRPKAGHRHAGGQNQTIAVQDAPSTGRQLQSAGIAHFALVQKEVVVEHLDVGGASAQGQKAQGNRSHHKFAAPNRGFAGQQGAGGVAHTPTHDVPPAASVAEPASTEIFFAAGSGARVLASGLADRACA